MAYTTNHGHTYEPDPLPAHPERTGVHPARAGHFLRDPAVMADGFQLRTWRGGPHARQPEIPPPLQTMVDRGLMEVRTGGAVPKAFFTKSGLAALRLLASDRRYMDPQKFAHIRTELGLQPKADVISDPPKKN